MPTAEKFSALVFARKNIGESDRLVTLFTKEKGLIRAIAKGVRKIPSSRGGHLEPYTRVAVQLHESKTGAYIGGVETDEYYHELHADPDALDRAQRSVQVFMKLFDIDQHMPELFDEFCTTWDMFGRIPFSKRTVLEIALGLRIMASAGILPDLQACSVCSLERPSANIIFELAEGSWHCDTCKPATHGDAQALLPKHFAVLKYIARNPAHAPRIALSDSDADVVGKAAHMLMAHAMVYS